MKRYSLVSLVLLFGVTTASAQYRAGMSSIGGTFEFEVPETGAKSLTLAPSYSYSLSDKLALGGEVMFMGEGEARIFGLAPFVRGNLPINDRAGAFGRVMPMFLFGKLATDLSMTSFGFGADAGLYYWISERFSIELTLSEVTILNTSIDFDGTEVFDETNFSGAFSPADVSLSILYHF